MNLHVMLMMVLGGADHTPASFSFDQLQDQQYLIINDGVMGGVSSSRLDRTAQALQFSGSVSLDNNGGFASVRMVWPFIEQSWQQDPSVLVLTVKGDGRRYQFRLRTNRGFDGAAYTQSFNTLAGQTQSIYLPVDQFIPTFRGRVLRDMPPLRLVDVQQMGVLVADQQVGAFSIELKQLTVE
ncbi:CIA30 family protein [Marinicella meishanensis]|uniref:CIA30 family protein n=1 Tax=Marinicella meishanensis TaxID=2873263 RepID=UPI001CBFEF4B|nr:CIA30 family protein [Marinicella sp. NBU2979]